MDDSSEASHNKLVVAAGGESKDADSKRPISRPISIAASCVKMPPPLVPRGHNGNHSPSSTSMSSTPSAEGSSSQSEYFSYEPDDQTGSLKATPRTSMETSRPFSDWKPSLGTDYEILQSLKVGERFDEQVAVFEGILSKKRRRRGTGFQKVIFLFQHSGPLLCSSSLFSFQRFCRLDQGYLLYAKNRADVSFVLLTLAMASVCCAIN
jgi:hypothetical protein